MRTLQYKVAVDRERKVTIRLPDDVEVGETEIVVVVNGLAQSPKMAGSVLDALPASDPGPWPEGFSVRREEIYGDDGR